MLKILFLLLSVNAFAIGGSKTVKKLDDISGIVSANNMVQNGGFEQGTFGWTASGGTFAATTTSPAFGNTMATWDSSSASQTLTSTAVTIPQGLIGRNAVIGCYIKTTSGTATHTLSAFDGTNAVASGSITSSTSTFALTTINFVAPSSGTLAVRLTSVASDEPEISTDNCFIADASLVNISQVNQATSYGATSWFGVSTSPSTTSASFVTITNANLATRTNEGSAVNPSNTNDLATRFLNVAPSKYKVTFNGTLRAARNTTNTACVFAIYDGTSRKGYTFLRANAASTEQETASITGLFTYTTTQASIEFSIQAVRNNGDGTCSVEQTTNSGLAFTVEKYPLESETAYRPEINNWRVDATIEGANPSLGTSNQTSYVGITNGSLTLTNNTGALTAKIPCSATNAPTGTTCSAGDESVGVNFDLPVAGAVEACVYFSHYISNPSGASVTATFQIIETPNNAQTISQEGLTKQSSAFSVNGDLFNPMSNCSIFNFNSAGNKTLRLMYEQQIVNTPTANQIIADANTSSGQRNIRWIVRPITQNIPAPVLVGSVTYNDTVIAQGALGQTTIASGNYTATITNNANITNSSLRQCSYTRIGNIVDVNCTIGLTCNTAAGTSSNIDVSLPVPSNFTASSDAQGQLTADIASEVGEVYADTVNDRAEVGFRCQSTSSLANRQIQFKYLVRP